MFSKIADSSHAKVSFNAAAGALMCAFAASAAAVGAPDHCIVGGNAIGCRSERTVAMLTGGYRGNGDSLRQEIESQIDSGACRLFQYGERVYSTDVAAADIAGKLRTAIRRPGDATTYFMPASWSRPVSECSDTPSASAMERKLGMAGFAPGEGDAALTDADRAGRHSPDEDVAGASLPQRLVARQDMTQACVIKPVMTDRDLAACRSASR